MRGSVTVYNELELDFSGKSTQGPEVPLIPTRAACLEGCKVMTWALYVWVVVKIMAPLWFGYL